MNYETIGICYATGATGTYLEYIGNVFLIPRIPFHNPFTLNGSSHGSIYSDDKIFWSGHFYLDPIQSPGRQFKFIDRPHKMVWIRVDEKDYDKFKLVKKYKVTSFAQEILPELQHGPVEITKHTTKIINDYCEQPYDLSFNEQQAWAKNNSPFIFNWRQFFSEDTFFAELKKLCCFCEIKFKPTKQLVSIHKDFLSRHSYVQFRQL